MSFGRGLSIVGSCCVARKTRLSPCMAASRAATEDSRPIKKAAIWKGKTTTSRMGTIGIFAVSYFSLELIRWVRPCPLPPGEGRVRACLAGFFERKLDFLFFDHL